MSAIPFLNNPRLRKVLRIAAWILGGLALVLVLVIGGALVWLRTPSAERFIAKTATEALADQGLTLTMDSFEGPLPGHLLIKNIALADKKGVWFKAERLETEIRLSALLTKTVDIRLVRLDAPEVLRIPELPPSPPAQPEPEPKESSSGFSLPVAIRLDSLRLDKGRVYPPVLYPGPDCPKDLQPLHFAMHGNAGISGRELSSALDIAVFHPGSEYNVLLRMGEAPEPEKPLFGATSSILNLAPGTPSPERLTVRVRARDHTGGLLSRITGNPALPAFAVDMDGAGTFSQWRMNFATVAGEKDKGAAAGENGVIMGASQGKALDFIPENARLAAVDGALDLAVSGNTNGLMGLAKALWNVSLEASVQPGPKLPQQARELAAPSVALAAKAEANPGARGGLTATVHDLTIKSGAWQAAVKNAHARMVDRTGATVFDAALEALVTDAASLARALGMTPPGISNAVLTANLQGSANVPATQRTPKADPPGNRNRFAPKEAPKETSALLTGKLEFDAEQERFVLDYGMDAAIAGTKALLRQAKISGIGIDVTANAEADTASGATTATASVTAKDKARWQELAARFAGKQGDFIGGAVNASLNAEVTADKKIDATAAVRGSNMRWPTEQLTKLLGPSVLLSAKAVGGGTAPYVVDLVKAEAAAVKASGHAEYAQNAKKPTASRIKAAFKASLDDTGLLAPGISGPVALEAGASGTAGAPVFDAKITSPALHTPNGAFEGILATVAGNATTGDKGQSVAATVASSVAKSPAGALDLKAALTADMASNGGMTAKANNVSFTMEGLALKADLNAAMPAGKKAHPSADGTASLRVEDWNALSRLTGLPLSGENTGIDAVFSHDNNKQTASLRLDASRFAFGDIGEEAVSISDLKGVVDAADLFTAPTATATITTGKSAAGPMNWETGAIAADFKDGKGAFNVELRADGVPRTRQPGSTSVRVRTTPRRNRAARTQSAAVATKTTNGRPSRAERLILSGVFSQKPLQVTLDRFATRFPDSYLGLYLTKPVTVNLAKGVHVDDLNMAILPKGKITASAAMQGQKADVDAAIDSLPLSLARVFASDAPVPDGSLSATVKMRKNGASVTGNADLTAAITPTLPAGSRQKPVPFLIHANSSLERSPDPRFPFLRTIPGITRLRGNLGFGPSGGGASVKKNAALAALDGASAAPADATAKEAQAEQAYTAAAEAIAASKGMPKPALYFDIPLRFAANGVPSPAENVPLAANFSWQGFLAPLWQALPMPDRSVDGVMRANAAVSGTMANPVYNASAYLAGGRFEDKILGVLLQDMKLELTSATKTDTKLLFSASDGRDGTVSLEGILSAKPVALRQQAAALFKTESISDDAKKLLAKRAQSFKNKPPTGPFISARGHINHLRPLHRDDLAATLSGRISVNGPVADPFIEANVEVERGEVTLLSTLGGGVRTLEISNPADAGQDKQGGGMLLVDVNIPNRFYIRGRGLDCEWAGKLHITGPTASPSLTGSLRPIRGSFDLLSRPFEFSGGQITFFGGDRIDPGLGLELTYTGPNITAIVQATGRASKPAIKMESKPSLPQDQIIAEVLFGKDFSSLSRFEALQVANSVRQLANIGEGGLDPVTSLRRSLGIDMLRVGSSGNGSSDRSVSGAPDASSVAGPGTNKAYSGGDDTESMPTVEAGKYINDAIYVGIEQGTTADSTGVRVEVELLPNLTLQGKSTSKSSTVGLGWKKDY